MDADFSPGLGAVNVLPTISVVDGLVAGPRRPTGWLARLLVADGPLAYRRALCAFALVVVAFSTLVVMGGPCIQVIYGHDTIGFLASAWRVRNGVLPHTDYHSALGALNPWLSVAAMWIVGPTADALPFASVVFAATVGLLAWSVAARRLPAVLAAFFAATQFIVAVSPHLLRHPWFAATYDGYYNRQCYALVDVLLLLFFVPVRRGEAGRTERRDDLLAGAMLGVLLFVKVSYFIVGVGLGGLACVLVRRSRRLRWEIALGFGTVFALCLPLIRFDLAAFLGDLRWAAAVRPAADSAATFSAGVYLQRFCEAWFEVGLLAVVQAFLRPPRWFRHLEGSGAGENAPSWAEFAGIAGASALICTTNSPAGIYSETPLLASWAFVLLAFHTRGLSAGRPRAALLRRDFAPACGLSGLLWVYTFGSSLVCLCWTVSPVPLASRQAFFNRAPVIESDSLADLRISGHGGEAPSVVFANKVNDGLRLLRALGGTHRVETLDFVNPFPFALRWPVTRGGVWCWDIGFSFSPTLYPPAGEVFGETDVLMVPKVPNEKVLLDTLTKIYSPYITEHFELASESTQWYLLRRR